MKYSTKILDMGILLEMESLLNTHGGVSRCIMECRQLAGEVCHSQQLLDKLSYIDDWLCRFSSISKLCASQKEFDEFLTLAEKLKENSPGH